VGGLLDSSALRVKSAIGASRIKKQQSRKRRFGVRRFDAAFVFLFSAARCVKNETEKTKAASKRHTPNQFQTSF
jgi:hypothetical protein